MTHPRLKHYPQHQSYLDSDPGEFRPFVMYVNRPLFRSPAVNTDRYGMREQYDSRGQLIKLDTCAQTYQECNVLVGGSTAFGVDATSDRRVISHYLNRDGCPCLNLSIRGATSQQEFIVFLLLRRLLPKVNSLVLFSGINNVALASVPDTLFYPEFGALFCEDQQFERFYNQYELFGASRDVYDRHSFQRMAGKYFSKSRLLRSFYHLMRSPNRRTLPEKPRYTFDEKLDLMLQVAANDIDSWASFHPNKNFRVHYVLQPVLTWTAKTLTEVESECFEADLDLIPSMRVYTNQAVYTKVSTTLSEACQRSGIDFYDANVWLGDPKYSKLNLFTDVVHLTDLGNKVIAEQLLERISWEN
jgi:hypothetical protein